MNYKEYIDLLCERYQRFFNIKRQYELMGNILDIFAEYNVRNERFIFSKKAVIDAYENYEYCLVKSIESFVDASTIDNFTDYLIKVVDVLVKPSSTHMCTYLTGVIIAASGFSEEAALKVKKFKYSKDYLFTLKGWCDARLILVYPETLRIVTNKKGREVEKYYNFF